MRRKDVEKMDYNKYLNVPTKYLSVYGDKDESRRPIPAHVKKEVYNRFKRCESCGRKLSIKQGEFHHIHKPKFTAKADTLQFLCATCHSLHGHKWVHGELKRLKVRKRRGTKALFTKKE